MERAPSGLSDTNRYDQDDANVTSADIKARGVHAPKGYHLLADLQPTW
jgi:hypothetical protein